MATFLFVSVVIIYSVWDIRRLNKELLQRINVYNNNEKNISIKPSCDIRKAVFLYAAVITLAAVITIISELLAALMMILCIIISTAIRKRKIKQISQLDEQNQDYWRWKNEKE